MDEEFFTAFRPDGDALLRAIGRRTDDSILDYIAGLDPVGSAERIAKILDELRKLRDQRISGPSPWEHVEDALEFASQGEPDPPHASRRGLPGTRGHWARAFACAALMRFYGEEDIRSMCTGIYNPSLIQLMESLRALDAGLEAETMAFLAWFILCLGNEALVEAERVFAGIALLSVAARSPAAPDAAVVALSHWLIAEEARWFVDGGGDFEGQRSVRELQEHAAAGGPAGRTIAVHWLFRMTHTLLHAKWIALGAELAACDVPGARGDAVRAIGARLSGQRPP